MRRRRMGMARKKTITLKLQTLITLWFLIHCALSFQSPNKFRASQSEAKRLAVGAEANNQQQQQQHNQYDIVLSSGFLAFGRHIGFLKAVEETIGRENVSLMVGTSSGAFIGALWACGYNTSEIAALVQPRRPVSLLRPAFRFWRGAVSFGPMIHYLGSDRVPRLPARLEDLPLPLLVGVTAVPAGANVLLGAGPLPRAVAASCAVPGLFSAVDVGGTLYQDGGCSDRMGMGSYLARRAAAAAAGTAAATTLLVHDVASSQKQERRARLLGLGGTEEEPGAAALRAALSAPGTHGLRAAAAARSPPSRANLLKWRDFELEIEESYTEALEVMLEIMQHGYGEHVKDDV